VFVRTERQGIGAMIPDFAGASLAKQTPFIRSFYFSESGFPCLTLGLPHVIRTGDLLSHQSPMFVELSSTFLEEEGDGNAKAIVLAY
jgi:hypothetical protein